MEASDWLTWAGYCYVLETRVSLIIRVYGHIIIIIIMMRIIGHGARHPKQSQYCQFVCASYIFHSRVEKSHNQSNKCKQLKRQTHSRSQLSLQMLSGGWTGHRVTAAKHIVMSQPAITRGEEELHLGLGK